MLCYFTSYLPVLWQQIRADMIIFKPQFKDRIIDFFIYISLTVVVMAYLLTEFGVRADFGIFTAATLVATSGMFEVFPRAVNIVSDITGNKVISYDLTLPLPSWMAIARIGLTDAIRGFIVAIFALPFGLMFVWPQFQPALFSPFWFMLLLVVNALFFGFFGLFMASLIKNMSRIDVMWMRIMFPLWTLGGFQFTWQGLHTKSALLSYVALLNPFLYTMEGMRAAVIGQPGSLPLWLCFVATLGFTFLCGYVGVRLMMKRLDVV